MTDAAIITDSGPAAEEIDAAIRLLRSLGYTVTPPALTREWETPGEFTTRIGIGRKHFVHARSLSACPQFRAEYGPTGRMLRLVATEELERFMTRHRADSASPDAPPIYPASVTPEMVRGIHAYYVAHTLRQVAIDRQIEEGWISLLMANSLEGKRITLEDIQIAIRYLQKRVSNPAWRGPRNPGCLKLTKDNLFCIHKFTEDLAEARSILGKYIATKKPAVPVAVAAPAPAKPMTAEELHAMKRFEEERALRKQLKEGS